MHPETQRSDEEQLAEIDAMATRTLAQYFTDEAALNLAVVRLKKHVRSLTDEELARPDQLIEQWAKAYAKEQNR